VTGSTAPTDPLPPGFTDVSLLTKVGCGPVYRARAATAGGRLEEVGVTLVETPVRDRGARRRLRNSCLAAVALNAQPSVLAVRDVGFTDDHRPFLVSDVPTMGTLADRISQVGPLPLGDAVTLAIALARALDAAHREGVLHLGIAPDSVFYGDDRRPVLGHFGLSWAVRPPTLPDVPAQEIVHAPRELFGWEEPTVGSDVYGLASVVRTALTGQAPFEAEARISRAALYHRLVQGSPPPGLPGLPDAFAKLLERMMDADPTRRPAVGEVVAALDEVARIPGVMAAGSVTAVRPPVVVPPSQQPLQQPPQPQAAVTPRTAAPAQNPAMTPPLVVPSPTPTVAPQAPAHVPVPQGPVMTPPVAVPQQAPPAQAAEPETQSQPRPRQRNTGLILLVTASVSALVAGIAWGVATAPKKSDTPQSGPLVTISAFPDAQAPAYEATDVRAVATGGTVTVSWTQPQHADGVQNYLVIAELYGRTDQTSLVPAGKLSTTFSGLQSGVPYCFAVTTYATAPGDTAPHTATTPQCATVADSASTAPST
jgi:hypothetical protein